jgi:hypothetical protein
LNLPRNHPYKLYVMSVTWSPESELV